MSDQLSITDKQRQARRENGKKGQGPTSPEGKARSAQNAVKHGYYARTLRPIHRGPLREDPAEIGAFVDAIVDELAPGDSPILRQAALDVADKAWRLSRAQAWEAEGFAGTEYGSWSPAPSLRVAASHDRQCAEAVRRSDHPDISDEDLKDAVCALGFSRDLSEEDVDWVDDAGRDALAEGLASLISEFFADRDEAASFLEKRAEDQEAEARSFEFRDRPTVIRRELDGPFARNAERLVSQASREYDRSLKRYWDLKDRIGAAGDDESGDEDGPDLDGGSVPRPDGDTDPTPGGVVGGGNIVDIFAHWTADEVVELLGGLRQSGDTGDPPTRNEPTPKEVTV